MTHFAAPEAGDKTGGTFGVPLAGGGGRGDGAGGEKEPRGTQKLSTQIMQLQIPNSIPRNKTRVISDQLLHFSSSTWLANIHR